MPIELPTPTEAEPAAATAVVGHSPRRAAASGWAGLATACAAALVAGIWAWGWLWWFMRIISDESGEPVEVPGYRAVDFALLVGALALLAWLVGSRTRLGRWAPVVVAAVLLVWSGCSYLLHLQDVYAAWVGFEGPNIDAADVGLAEHAASLAWLGFAGPLAALACCTAAAWLGGRGTLPTPEPPTPEPPTPAPPTPAPPTPAPPPPAARRVATAVAGLGVLVGAGLVGWLAVLAWGTTGSVGPWPPDELFSWQFIALAVCVGVAWATSGRGRETAALVALAALVLLLYGYGTALGAHVLYLPVALLTVLAAAARRPMARALARLAG